MDLGSIETVRGPKKINLTFALRVVGVPHYAKTTREVIGFGEIASAAQRAGTRLGHGYAPAEVNVLARERNASEQERERER